MNRFMLPDLGEGLEDAQIVEWHVQQGQAVAAGEAIVSVETAKAIVDIPAPVSGVIETLAAGAGETVAVGDLLVEIKEPGDNKAVERPYTGIVGDIRAEDHAVKQAAGKDEPVSAQAPATVLPPDILATPSVRSAAAQRGIDLSNIQGSGPEGSITHQDLDLALTADSSATSISSRARSTSTRQRMAATMQKSGARVVPATVHDVADVNDWPANADATDRLIEGIVQACQIEPSLNAFFDEKSQSPNRQTVLDLGIAVDAPAGLFVPVLRDAAGQVGTERRKQLDQLVSAARAGTIRPDQMSNPTLTLSNFGSLGGQFASLVIVPPQVAILGTGEIRPAVVPVADGIGVRRLLPISLTFDHRAVTGGEAVRFLKGFVESLESGNHQPTNGESP